MQTLKAMDLSANVSSGVFGSLESSTRMSVQVTWTGTPTGVFTLMGTNEEGPTANFTAVGPITNPSGAAGSVIAVMLWIYYSAQIFLLGAEFTSVYAQYRASVRRSPGESAPPNGRESAAPRRTSQPEHSH